MSEIADSIGALSELKNPFLSDKVESIGTYCYKGSMWDEWKYTGSIKFKNGDTKGEQRFEAKDFAALIKKMEIFLKDLEKPSV